MRFSLTKFCNDEITTPPAVSVKIPSVSAKSFIPSLISDSGTAIALPSDSLISFKA